MYILRVVALFVSAKNVVPYVPSNLATVKDALRFIDSGRPATFIDLGSGFGDVCVMVSKEFGYKVCGYENNMFMVIYAKLMSFFKGHKKVAILHKDFFKAPIQDFDVVYFFLMPRVIESREFSDSVLRKVKKGAYVISHWYQVPSLANNMVYEVTSKDKAYVYKI